MYKEERILQRIISSDTCVGVSCYDCPIRKCHTVNIVEESKRLLKNIKKLESKNKLERIIGEDS